MLFRLLLLFTAVPLIELVLLFWLAKWTSWTATLALVLATGVLGAYLARREGFRTMVRIQSSVSQGVVPTGELVEAALIVAAGLVLITPGVLTDIVGFCLLIRPLRRRVRDGLIAYFAKRIVVVRPGGTAVDERGAGPGTFVDVEATSVEPTNEDRQLGSDD